MATERAAEGQLPLLVLGSASGRRMPLLQAARAGLGLPAAQLVEWRDWLRNPSLLESRLEQPCLLKIESPGDDPTAQHQLLIRGSHLLQRTEPDLPQYGELVATDAWFAGLSDALQGLQRMLGDRPHLRVMNAPEECLLMTDKLACQQHLQQHKVPTPLMLGPVTGYAQMQALLDQHQLDRIYLKARYGSSAAGVLAYRRASGGREQATTTAQLVRSTSGAQLYNVKRMRRYESRGDIETVVDLLASQQAYAEQWVAKPRAGRGHYDIRIVTLGGQAAHRVARIGEQAMTNLHLGNQRGQIDTLLSQRDELALENAAQLAAASFPRSHVIGFDIVVKNGRTQVLEANAFGDLLPGLLWQGQDTYAAQLQTWLQ